MRPQLDSAAVLDRYEEAIKYYHVFTCWLATEHGKDFASFLDINSGHLEKLRRLNANIKGAEQILGLERAYVERLGREAKEEAERLLALGML